MASPLPVPGKRFVIGVPYVWLFVFFFLPFLILLYISFVDQGESINPFKPIWDPETGILALKYENYWTIFRDGDMASCSRPSTSRPTCARSGTRSGRPCCAWCSVTRSPTSSRVRRPACARPC